MLQHVINSILLFLLTIKDWNETSNKKWITAPSVCCWVIPLAFAQVLPLLWVHHGTVGWLGPNSKSSYLPMLLFMMIVTLYSWDKLVTKCSFSVSSLEKVLLCSRINLRRAEPGLKCEVKKEIYESTDQRYWVFAREYLKNEHMKEECKLVMNNQNYFSVKGLIQSFLNFLNMFLHLKDVKPAFRCPPSS